MENKTMFRLKSLFPQSAVSRRDQADGQTIFRFDGSAPSLTNELRPIPVSRDVPMRLSSRRRRSRVTVQITGV